MQIGRAIAIGRKPQTQRYRLSCARAPASYQSRRRQNALPELLRVAGKMQTLMKPSHTANILRLIPASP